MLTVKKSSMLTMESVGKRIQDIWSRHDAAGFAALYAIDAVVLDPLNPTPLKGREAIKKSMENMWKSFPDSQFTFSNAVTQGKSGAIEVVISGTHSAPLVTPKGTIGGTNKRVELRSGGFFKWNDEGLITETHRYYDTASIMRQLGVGA